MYHTLVPGVPLQHATVCGRDGTKLGIIEQPMIEKPTAAVAYGVIRTGGRLGSQRHHPILWRALRYDRNRRGYDLRTGQSEFDDDAFDCGDRSRSYPHPRCWTV